MRLNNSGNSFLRLAGTIARLKPGIVFLVAVTGLAACTAPVSSFKEETGKVAAGLPYYLPRRPVLITITVDKNTSLPSVTVAAGTMEPDLDHRFILTYNQNAFGTNAAVVSVNPRGLMQISNNTITSATGQIATNLGATLGAVTGAGLAAADTVPKNPPCVGGQTYMYNFHPTDGTLPTLACSITISIHPAKGNTSHTSLTTMEPDSKTSHDGIYFRQELPYLVEAQDSAGNLMGRWQFYSPDQSDTFFYPVTKTLFANSHTNFIFSDGVLTNVDQAADSEINGVLTLPANILSGYTTALGQVFTAFSNTRNDRQTNMLNDAKLQYCQAVIAANPMTGKSATDQATAVVNIKAACGA